MLLLLCGLKQCMLHHELCIGEHRVKTICEELRWLFRDADDRQSMAIALMTAREMRLKPKLMEALKDDKKIMAIVKQRQLVLQQVELA